MLDFKIKNDELTKVLWELVSADAKKILNIAKAEEQKLVDLFNEAKENGGSIEFEENGAKYILIINKNGTGTVINVSNIVVKTISFEKDKPERITCPCKDAKVFAGFKIEATFHERGSNSEPRYTFIELRKDGGAKDTRFQMHIKFDGVKLERVDYYKSSKDTNKRIAEFAYHGKNKNIVNFDSYAEFVEFIDRNEARVDGKLVSRYIDEMIAPLSETVMALQLLGGRLKSAKSNTKSLEKNN